MFRSEVFAALDVLGCSQYGLATHRQLDETGVGKATLSRWIATGIVVPAANDVVRFVGAPPSWRQRVMLATLTTGGWASHRTAAALRGLEAVHFEVGGSDLPTDPAVLLLAPDLTVRRQTPAAEYYIRPLLPTPDDRLPVPAAAYNVAAQLLALEAGVDRHPAWSRVWSRPGLLLTFRAARIHRRDRPMDTSDIAVTIERATPGERLDLFGRVHDLTPRETEVLRCLADGDDTREVAARLHLSAYTVQDHLTTVFDKTGVRSRRALLARATG